MQARRRAGLENSPSSLLQNELIRNSLGQPVVLELKVLRALHLLDLPPTGLMASPRIRHLAHADLTDCVHRVMVL
jgi:hypothetical protein